MKKISFAALMASLLAIAACSLQRPHLSTSSLYDLGPAPKAAAQPQPAVRVSVAEVNPAPWLDSAAMYYRLLYANDQQPRAYAQNRWVMPPAHMLGQRMKARIAQAGGIAASAADGAENLSMVRVEADDFSHVFDAADKSHGQVALRVSVFSGRVLIAQKSFAAHAAAPSHDPAGGARALAAASDAAIDDMIAWLGTLPLKR